MNDRLLTEKQAADLVASTPRTLKQWRCVGKGPKFVKIGRSVRYRLSDVNEYIKQL